MDRNPMGQNVHLDGESKVHEMIDANRRIEQLINPAGNGSAAQPHLQQQQHSQSQNFQMQHD